MYWYTIYWGCSLLSECYEKHSDWGELRAKHDTLYWVKQPSTSVEQYTEDVLCCQNAMKSTVTEVSLELSMTPSVESSSHLLVLSHIPRMSVAVGMLWPWTMKRGGKNNNSPLLDVFILHIGNCLCIHLLHLMLWPLVVHLHLHTRSHFC